jgi:hypothetical protein
MNAMRENHSLATDRSPWPTETWWAQRRRRYNVGLLTAGLLGFIGYAAAVERCIRLSARGEWEITIVTTVFQACAYLVMIGVANLCYYLGPWLERGLHPVNIARYRKITFRLGFWFSVLLPCAPAALLLISCSLHRGEEKRIILELIKIAVFGQLS